MIPRTKLSARMGEPRRARLGFVAAIVLVATLAAWFYQSNPVTQSAQRYAVAVSKASGGTYITLRTLNAFLSTAQEVEVGGSFFVSGSAQPLKVLEPIDDTIERLAGLVFVVMVVTGVLAVSLGPVSAVGFGLIASAACLWGLQRSGKGAGRFAGLSLSLGRYGVFLALAVPLAFVLTALLADRMTAEVWDQHQAVISEITREVAPQDGVDPTVSEGWMDGMQSLLGKVENYQDLAASIYARADELIGSFVSLLSVYVFKLLILPLLILGGLYVVLRMLLGRT